MALNELTKAQLIVKVREAQDREAEMRNERDAWKDQVKTAPAPTRVAEAEALAGCVRALNAVPAMEGRNGNTYNQPNHDPETIARVLRSLASRYNVNLFETVYQPCDRTHLDQIDPGFVSEALRQAVMR